MKLYDLTKKLLTETPEYRDSDKKLMWKVWSIELHTPFMTSISINDFLTVSTPESITRARRMVQQDFKDLGASITVAKRRRQKEVEKGTHIYRERVRWVGNTAIVEQEIL